MEAKTVEVKESGVSTCFEAFTFGKKEPSSPSVAFTAGIHGDEVTGVYVAQKLIEMFENTPPQNGCVRIIPVVNAAAMRCMQRRSPFDGEDLNRIFPGKSGGSISHALAAAVYAQTDGFDMIVDLHCCSQYSAPYILSIYSEHERIRRLANSITLPVALHSEGTPGQLFTESCRRRAQAALIIELPSGGGKGEVNTEVAGRCFAALRDMLCAYGFIDGEIRGAHPTFYGKMSDIEAPRAGLWQPCVSKCATVPGGACLGTLDGQPVCANEDCFVLSIRAAAYIMPDELYLGAYIREEDA